MAHTSGEIYIFLGNAADSTLGVWGAIRPSPKAGCHGTYPGLSCRSPGHCRGTRDYAFQDDIDVRELGLGLVNVEAMRLKAEYQHDRKARRSALETISAPTVRAKPRSAFMFRDFDRLQSTRRVEVNVMTSPQFIEFIEHKLRENGVAKIIPNGEELYQPKKHGQRLEEAVAKRLDRIKPDDCKEPSDVGRRVRAVLKENPALRWDAAIERNIAGTVATDD